ncbi:MAG: zinc ribbon domain-containing protein [Candidatus Bathyarchaeota archaeon]|nr:MAG: zinc ribbon domain-containing protein [Candidatus Bathyarchaeota archaeon]
MGVCPKCGTKNEEDAKYCAQCGADLKTGAYPSRRHKRRREEECFGIPKGGTFVGLAIGVIIILWGFIWLLQQVNVLPKTLEIGPFAAIIFGILILVGALYGLSRK